MRGFSMPVEPISTEDDNGENDKHIPAPAAAAHCNDTHIGGLQIVHSTLEPSNDRYLTTKEIMYGR